jgi:CheY-like chemotaxis protein
MGRDPELPKHALTGLFVLVVEKDRETAALLSKILTHCGALVSLVASVKEATATLARVTPDVVVASVARSDDRGLALIRTIHERTRAKRPGAVAVLAHDESGTAERVLRAGFDAHVVRPLDPWELCAVVAGAARRLS